MNKPTEEQAAVVDAFHSGARDIVVEAGAGAGKTSTIVYAANAKPELKGALLVFNKMMAEETKPRLQGTSCAVSTLHSLAWRSQVAEPFTRGGGARLKGMMPSRFAAHSAGIMGPIVVSGEMGETRQKAVGEILKDWVSRFCASDDDALGAKHFPGGTLYEFLPKDLAAKADENPKWFSVVCREYARDLLPNAQRLWALMSDPNTQFPSTHDVYLKLFVMSRPNLPLDYVMLDEVQDSNAVTLQLIRQLAERGTQALYVGDSHQQLYAWRGAVDAIQRIDAGARLRLTQSFRFGPAVAEVANAILGDLMKTDFRIVGAGPESSILESMDNPTAVICRTNDTALKMALSDRSKGRRAGLCMDPKELVREVDNLERFKQRGVSDAKRFARFGSYDELLEAIEHGDAPDLKILLSVIDDYAFDGARQILSELAVGKKPDEIARSGASTIYLTGHGSKGLQFERVRLGDDFKGGEKLDALPNKKEELNILYVAATRAQKALCLGDSAGSADLKAALAENHERSLAQGMPHPMAA